MGRWGTSRLFKLSTQVTVFVCAIVLWESASLTGLLSRTRSLRPSTSEQALGTGAVLIPVDRGWPNLSGLGDGRRRGSVLAILVGTLLGRSRFAYASVIPVVEFLKTCRRSRSFRWSSSSGADHEDEGVPGGVRDLLGADHPGHLRRAGGRPGRPRQRTDSAIARLATVHDGHAAQRRAYIATGMRVAAAVGLILAVIAEMIGGAAGLGLNILDRRQRRAHRTSRHVRLHPDDRADRHRCHRRCSRSSRDGRCIGTRASAISERSARRSPMYASRNETRGAIQDTRSRRTSQRAAVRPRRAGCVGPTVAEPAPAGRRALRSLSPSWCVWWFVSAEQYLHLLPAAARNRGDVLRPVDPWATREQRSGVEPRALRHRLHHLRGRSASLIGALLWRLPRVSTPSRRCSISST